MFLLSIVITFSLTISSLLVIDAVSYIIKDIIT